MKLSVSLDGKRAGIRSGESLLSALEELDERQYLEVWIERGAEMMSMVTNTNQAWLMYLREDEACFRSHNPQEPDDDRLIECRMADGQRDTYPCSWMVPRTEASRVLALFLDHGGRPEAINWKDESDSYPGRKTPPTE
jgi:hypothetical protein